MGGVGELGEEVKGFKGTNGQLQNSDGDAKCHTRNIVNHIVIGMSN